MRVAGETLPSLPLAGVLARGEDPAETLVRRRGGGLVLIDPGDVDAAIAAHGADDTHRLLEQIAAAVDAAREEGEELFCVGVGQLLLVVPQAKTFGMVLQRVESLRPLVEAAASEQLVTVLAGALGRRGMVPYSVLVQRLWDTLKRARAGGRRALVYREHATLTPAQVTGNMRAAGCEQPVVAPVVDGDTGNPVAWWVTAEQPTWLQVSDRMLMRLGALEDSVADNVPVVLCVDAESMDSVEQAELLAARLKSSPLALELCVAVPMRCQSVEPDSHCSRIVQTMARAGVRVLGVIAQPDQRALAAVASLPGLGVVFDMTTSSSPELNEYGQALIALLRARGATRLAIGVQARVDAIRLQEAGMQGIGGRWASEPVRPELASSAMGAMQRTEVMGIEPQADVRVPTSLPILPSVLARVRAIGDGGGQEVLTLASSDPSTAMQLVAMASEELEPDAPLLTLPEALVKVGTAIFRSRMLEESVGEVFLPNTWAGTRLWLHPVQAALWAGAIARMLKLTDVSEAQAYLAGLLHDVGRFALFHRDHRGLARADADGGRGLSDIPLAERRVFAVDHATLGGQLCREWGLQERLAGVVELHHVLSPVSLQDGTTHRLLRIVQMADLLSEQMLLETPGEEAKRGERIRNVMRRIVGAPRIHVENLERLWEPVVVESRRRMRYVGLDELA